MTTTAYFPSQSVPGEDVQARHILPSLSLLMPMKQSGQSQGLQYSSDMSPSMGSMLVGQTLLTQASPDVFSQNSVSQPGTANTTPASNLNNSNYVVGSESMMMPNSGMASNMGNSVGHLNSIPASFPGVGGISAPVTEKCTCKSNQNRIPRPRNAFILFRQKNHQLVLEEGSVVRTNPDVSRELGKRWRMLSAEEKNHWIKLAEEEKIAHAKKYPGYKYTPRRNGKNKSCPACRQKALRLQQIELHNQQMYQLQQDQYQQFMQMQQHAPQQSQPSVQGHLPGQAMTSQQIPQYIVQPSRYSQTMPLSYGVANTDLSAQQQMPQPIQLQGLQQPVQHEKLSPLSSMPYPNPINDYLNLLQYSGYDQPNPNPHRFNSLPVAMPNYNFEFGNLH